MAGTVVRVRGLKRYQHAKTGAWYCYHRASGKRIVSDFGTPGFFEELAAIEAALRVEKERAAKFGTLGALLKDYKATDSYLDLSARTKADYEKVFTFLEPLWHTPVPYFTALRIVELRNEWRKECGRRFVNDIRSVLSLLMSHAVGLGLIAQNPLRDIKSIRKANDAPIRNRPWSLQERCNVIERAPAHLKLPIILAMFYGFRQGDVLRLPRWSVVPAEITLTTRKRRVPVSLLLFPEIRAAIAEHDKALAARRPKDRGLKPVQLKLCLNSQGDPWTESGFRASLRTFLKILERDRAIAPGLTFHGLRHTVATVLADAGVDEETIAAWLGQRTVEMARHYSREARRSRQVRAAAQNFNPLKGD